jgi:predicted nuclease with TOPRIM domain
MNLMEDHMRKMHYREKDLLKELSRLRGDVRRVSREENKLKMQESNLDKQFKKMQDEVHKIEKNSWGEGKENND